MDRLSDQLLLEAYEKALELNLSDDFIALIKDELIERELFISCELNQEHSFILRFFLVVNYCHHFFMDRHKTSF